MPDATINTIATYAPYASTAYSGVSFAFNKSVGYFAGTATAEGYATDAISGRLLWEGVDKRGGTSALVKDTLDNWVDIHHAFETWSVRLAVRDEGAGHVPGACCRPAAGQTMTGARYLPSRSRATKLSHATAHSLATAATVRDRAFYRRARIKARKRPRVGSGRFRKRLGRTPDGRKASTAPSMPAAGFVTLGEDLMRRLLVLGAATLGFAVVAGAAHAQYGYYGPPAGYYGRYGPPPCQAVTPGPMYGAARGAAGGALIGAIAGNAGRGAAIGAGIGGIANIARRGSARSAGACY